MPTTPPTILNAAAYRFVELADTADWRERIRAQALSDGLKGTVLIAEEGINFCLAGPQAAVRCFLSWLRGHAAFTGLAAKESWSPTVPFRKLVVKVKPEIIRMNRPTIRPQTQRAPAIDPETLARWLTSGVDDLGREVVTLDTRNAFEVDEGRFQGTLDWRIDRFSDFPEALEAHRRDLAGKTVVSYCTGGIRCEKAALLMRSTGLEHVWQLEGGILKYFEITGGQHFQGHCFVFDERGALNDTLTPRRAD